MGCCGMRVVRGGMLWGEGGVVCCGMRVVWGGVLRGGGLRGGVSLEPHVSYISDHL